MRIVVPVPHLVGALALIGSVGALLWPRTTPPAPPQRTEAELEALRDVQQAIQLLALAASAPEADPADTTFGRRAAQAARAYLLKRPPGFRDDCSGYVSAIMTRAGAPMDGVVASIWDLAVEHDALHWDEVPAVGDLVFFDDTHDRDHDGEWNDALTHIGLVIDVDPEGVATFAHGGTSRGRTTGRIDVRRPSLNREDGRVVNSYVREPEPWDPAGSPYLAGELWVAWATVDPALDWLRPAEPWTDGP